MDVSVIESRSVNDISIQVMSDESTVIDIEQEVIETNEEFSSEYGDEISIQDVDFNGNDSKIIFLYQKKPIIQCHMKKSLKIQNRKHGDGFQKKDIG